MKPEHTEWENEMPEDFRLALDRVRTQPEPLESLGRFLQAAEGAEMTAAARNRGQINALLCLVAMIAVFAALVASVCLIFLFPIAVACIIAGFFMAVVVYVSFFWCWIRDLRAAGPILLDCGAFPARGMFALWVVGFSFLMIWVGIYAYQNIVNFRTLEGGAAIFFIGLCLAIVGYALIMTTGRLQIRANGIWHYFGLMKWYTLESWEWTGKHDATLLIQRKGRFPFLKRGALPVPMELRNQVEALLKAHTQPHFDVP